MCIPRARWLGYSAACATRERLFLWGPTKRCCWRERQTSSSGCRPGRSSIGPPAPAIVARTSNELLLGAFISDAGERHTAGMAVERCAEFHAVLFVASGGDLQFLI